MQVIPALDLLDGKCVRLHQGKREKTRVYPVNPLEYVRWLWHHGFSHIHIVDLNGALDGQLYHLKWVEQIRVQVPGIHISFGGGLRSWEKILAVFQAGVDRVVLGTVAVHQPRLVLRVLDQWGPHALLLASDFQGTHVVFHGWTQISPISLQEWISRWLVEGVQNFLCSDVTKDGTLQGPSVKVYQMLTQRFPEAAIYASGGIAAVRHLQELEHARCSGAIIGLALLEGFLTPEMLQPWLNMRSSTDTSGESSPV